MRDEPGCFRVLILFFFGCATLFMGIFGVLGNLILDTGMPKNTLAVLFLVFLFYLSVFLIAWFWEYVVDIVIGIFDPNPPIIEDSINMDKKLPSLPSLENTPAIPTFNLSGLNLLELDRELRKSLNSNASSFIFMRERENKKLTLQNDKVNIILQTIKDLNLTQKELTNFQADTFLSNELLDKIIASKREEINNIVELKKKEFLLKHKVLDDEIVKIDHNKEARETALEAAKLSNLKTKTEIMILTANSDEAKAKAKLIMYVLKELDLKNMPQTLQTYLITSIVNPQGNQYQDFDMQERLKKYIEKEADAKARITEADASIKESTAITTSKTKDVAVSNIEKLLNTTGNTTKPN